jgi:hypothetical protein
MCHRLEEAESMLEDSLKASTDSSCAIDGTMPMGVFKRLIIVVLHVKSMCSEQVNDFDGDGGIKAAQKDLDHLQALASDDGGSSLQIFKRLKKRVAAERLGRTVLKHVRSKATFSQFLPLLKNSERVRRESRRLSISLQQMVRRSSIAEH